MWNADAADIVMAQIMEMQVVWHAFQMDKKQVVSVGSIPSVG
jgi:hypothetical protein